MGFGDVINLRFVDVEPTSNFSFYLLPQDGRYTKEIKSGKNRRVTVDGLPEGIYDIGLPARDDKHYLSPGSIRIDGKEDTITVRPCILLEVKGIEDIIFPSEKDTIETDVYILNEKGHNVFESYFVGNKEDFLRKKRNVFYLPMKHSDERYTLYFGKAIATFKLNEQTYFYNVVANSEEAIEEKTSEETEEQREEQAAISPLEFYVEDEYTRVVYARELWEADGLRVPEQVEEELEGKYHKVWVLKLTVRGTSSEQEYVSFEVLPLIDANGERYYPICKYDDAFWKIFNGNVDMDYVVTKQCPITRLVPYLYESNAEGNWRNYYIPRNTIFKIGNSDTEVRSP
ncbi:MAG: hypothetical protein N3G19_03725 [Candidatus Pacearchaeota archaeon]|nr:hypothetical protein [Candidatus Pacearchaeota archaeon]